MIIVFVGPPYSGKGTQAQLLGEELGLPVFAMGGLIRQARDAGNQEIMRAHNEFSLSGRHIPTSIKFPLLKEKIDTLSSVILDNFPATQDDFTTFLAYLQNRNLAVDRVFNINISQNEMLKRMRLAVREGRQDDSEENVMRRWTIQDEDRKAVLDRFRAEGILEEVEGERDISVVHGEVMSRLGVSNKEKNGI